MSKDSWAKYYQDNNGRLKLVEDWGLSKEETEGKNNMVVTNTNVYKNMKKKSLLSSKKYYNLRKSALV